MSARTLAASARRVAASTCTVALAVALAASASPAAGQASTPEEIRYPALPPFAITALAAGTAEDLLEYAAGTLGTSPAAGRA